MGISKIIESLNRVTLSYNEAMKIQKDQFEYYSKNLSENGKQVLADELAADTKPCPDDSIPDEPMCIGDINNLVPRGCWFEQHRIMTCILHNSFYWTEQYKTEQAKAIQQLAEEKEKRETKEFIGVDDWKPGDRLVLVASHPRERTWPAGTVPCGAIGTLRYNADMSTFHVVFDDHPAELDLQFTLIGDRWLAFRLAQNTTVRENKGRIILTEKA